MTENPQTVREFLIGKLTFSANRRARIPNASKASGFERDALRSINYRLVPRQKRNITPDSPKEVCFLIKHTTGTVTIKMGQLTYREVNILLDFLKTATHPTAQIKENDPNWRYDNKPTPIPSVPAPVPTTVMTTAATTTAQATVMSQIADSIVTPTPTPETATSAVFSADKSAQTVKVIGFTVILKDVIASKSESDARRQIMERIANAKPEDFSIKCRDLTNDAILNFIKA